MNVKHLHPASGFLAAAMLVSLAWLPARPLAAATAPEPLAAVAASATLVTFQPLIPYDQVRVAVAGPGSFEIVATFGAAEIPSVELPGVDGLYKYELRFSPVIDRRTRRLLAEARQSGADLGSSRANDKRTVQRGWFTLAGGSPVAADLAERTDKVASAAAAVNAPVQNLVVSNSDGVIRNSLCVGFDCPNAPVFDDSTILMMENNTRIKFGDTSNSPFPNNDWEIEANSSLSGGASYLGFNDCGTADNDGGCANDLVFAVEAGARASALHVENDGDIGIGTSNPVLDIHVVTGNTPALRLDQDGSSGFTPQVWDVAGNETNFFIRDATGGSALPFRIRPGSPSNSIFIAGSSADVGFGTSAPQDPIHVLRSDATPTHVRIQNSNAGTQVTGVKMTNATTSWAFEMSGNGNFQISEEGSGGAEFLIDENAVNNQQKFRFADGATVLAEIQADGDINNLTGVYGTLSDRNLKTDIQAVDPLDVLARVAELPISTWRFKNHPDNVHLGPMAQDFWAAFGLYEGETSIALNDLSGVALAAIQGLNQQVAGLNREIELKDTALRELLERVQSLEAKLAGQ